MTADDLNLIFLLQIKLNLEAQMKPDSRAGRCGLTLNAFDFFFSSGDDGAVGSSRVSGGREAKAASSGEFLQKTLRCLLNSQEAVFEDGLPGP